MSSQNTKATGWNIIGRSFWDIGHVYIRENQNALNLFLDDIDPQQKVCIIGASGINLVKAAIERGIKPVVIDFSEKMRDDLLTEVSAADCHTEIHDVIYDSCEKFQQSFDYVLTDQVINCFARNNVPIFFKNISQMLRPQGQLRTIIKIGFYDIDSMLIDHGEQLGTVEKFYDPQQRTINYANAREELHATLKPHGEVPKEILVEWYINRGEESRFTLDDINQNLLNSQIRHGHFELAESIPISSLTRSTYFKFIWRPS